MLDIVDASRDDSSVMCSAQGFDESADNHKDVPLVHRHPLTCVPISKDGTLGAAEGALSGAYTSSDFGTSGNAGTALAHVALKWSPSLAN